MPVIPDFSGEWHISRRIVGANSRFKGKATIDEAGQYHERGILDQGRSRTSAYRSYIYQPDGCVLKILFPDGRVFLRLAFRDGEARDTHYCGADVYEALFRVRGQKWITVYKVAGPRKNYAVVSVMTRRGSLRCAG